MIKTDRENIKFQESKTKIKLIKIEKNWDYENREREKVEIRKMCRKLLL